MLVASETGLGVSHETFTPCLQGGPAPARFTSLFRVDAPDHPCHSTRQAKMPLSFHNR